MPRSGHRTPMQVTRRTLLGLVAGTASLAGCTGGGNGTNGGPATTAEPASRTPTATPAGGGPTTAATPTTTAGDAAGPSVRVAAHPDLGEILVGPDGMTLYMFDSDTRGAGASTCEGGCAEAWPPLVTTEDPTAGAGVTATLSTFEREPGERQVAAAGWPLYYFARDEAPGDATGQGAGGVWWVLGPDGTPIRSDETATPEETPTPTPTPEPTVGVRAHPEHGDILVGPRGMTLYAFDDDTNGAAASACYGGCADAWPPLTVTGEPTAGEGVSAALTTFEREDGARQVAAAGWPLYFYYRDENPGDALGHEVGAAWWVVRPDGTPIRPGGSGDGGSGDGGSSDGGSNY